MLKNILKLSVSIAIISTFLNNSSNATESRENDPSHTSRKPLAVSLKRQKLCSSDSEDNLNKEDNSIHNNSHSSKNGKPTIIIYNPPGTRDKGTITFPSQPYQQQQILQQLQHQQQVQQPPEYEPQTKKQAQLKAEQFSNLQKNLLGLKQENIKVKEDQRKLEQKLNDSVAKEELLGMSYEEFLVKQSQLRGDTEESNLLRNLSLYQENGKYYRNIEALRKNFQIVDKRIIKDNDLKDIANIAKSWGVPLIPPKTIIYVKICQPEPISPINTYAPYNDLTDWDILDSKMRTYLSVLNDLKKSKETLSDLEYQIAQASIEDFKTVELSRSSILENCNEMIKRNRFSTYFVDGRKAAIHIENGYVDQNNIFRGVKYDYDGIQIEDRLNMYHIILEESFNLARKHDRLIEFFKAFNNEESLDTRLNPLKDLIEKFKNPQQTNHG